LLVEVVAAPAPPFTDPPVVSEAKTEILLFSGLRTSVNGA